jgi:hypothetical protein
MVQAASGIKTDRFLSQELFPNADLNMDTERMEVLYFLKVIQVRGNRGRFLGSDQFANSKSDFVLRPVVRHGLRITYP